MGVGGVSGGVAGGVAVGVVVDGVDGVDGAGEDVWAEVVINAGRCDVVGVVMIGVCK